MEEFDLKKFRRDFNLKQSDLQNILGITQGYISRIETGKESLPLLHIEKLKELYGEDVIKKYIIKKQESHTIQTVIGNSNITNTGNIRSVTTNLDELINKIIELEKEVIKLKGEISAKDETIKGLKNELAVRIEMITFLQK